MKITLYLFLVLMLFSCKKFEHQEPTNTASCELCAWAESMEGWYTGLMKTDMTSPSGVSTSYDSVFVEVSQIFMNENAYNDSTVMYFQFIKYDVSMNDPNPNSFRGVALDSSGILSNSYYTYIRLMDDSLRLTKYVGFSWPYPGSYAYSGVLYL